MSKSGKIKVKTFGLIRDDKRLFVSEGYDSVKRQTFYRALGGNVDFGEPSRTALQREFQEEMQAELINIRYLGCLESIFVYEDKPGHELVQIYQCDFADSKLYQMEQIYFFEGKEKNKALWVEIDRFKSGELKLVPEQFLEYL